MSVTKDKDDFNIVISAITVTHCRKNRNMYFTTDFDGFKQCKSEMVTSTKEGKATWGDRFDFKYETKYINRLHTKHFKLTLYKKKSFGSDSLIGSVLIDLYTLATGPVQHDLLITKASTGVGRVQFKLSMTHVSKVRIILEQLSISNLHHSITSSHSDCTNYIDYSLNGNHQIQSAKIQGSLCPSWLSLPPISQILSLKDLVDSHIMIVFKEQRALKDKTVGQLQLPIKNIFTFIEGDTKIINTLLADDDNTKIADMTLRIQFNDIPQLAQLLEGIHTETGIQNAKPFFSGVPLPKLLGDISNPNTSLQHIQLPSGWEAKMDQFGRTYYIDHNTKQTTWTNPLSAAPVEKKKGSFLSNSNNGGGLNNSGGGVTKLQQQQQKLRNSGNQQQSREEKAAILIQRTFRRHRKDNYNKTIRKPNNFKQPNQRPSLPEGWECRLDEYGRLYYLDHINRCTTWTPPKTK